MKMYFFLSITLGVIICIYPMDNNNNKNNKRIFTQEEELAKLKEQEDLKNEQKAKELLDQMLQLGVSSGKYTPKNKSASNSPKSSSPTIVKRQIPSQNPNQSQTTITFIIPASENDVSTPLSSSPGMSRLAQSLKDSSLSSPATDRKSQNLLITQSNNNNNPFPVIMLPPSSSTHITEDCYEDNVSKYPMQTGSEQKITEDSSSDDDYSDKDYVSDKDYASDEENSPFTQIIQAKNWENANKLKKTARLLPDKDYKAAVDEYLIGLKVLHNQHQMNSEKVEQEAVNKLNAIKTAQPKSNKNNDQMDNNNNKK